MVVQISSFILAASLLGILGIVFPKLSQLRKFPQEAWGLRDVFSGAKEKVAQSEKLEPLNPEKLLHKLLMRMRILALKTDNKTSTWLENLRKRSDDREGRFKDAYWTQLRRGKKSDTKEE